MVLVLLLILTAALSSGRRAIREDLAVTSLPAPPPGAGNVVLIVLDSVRAESLGLYGYARDTTPHLSRWAARGVRFDRAIAPAPWTFPSHTSFFTGQWPYRLRTQLRQVLDAPFPTLAETLRARGYQTAGFVANTIYCSYETGLDRGFLRYEDYPLSPSAVLGSSVPGRWVVTNLLSSADNYTRKWLQYQARDAPGINRAFLDWLDRRRADRPFFAFLNFMDAHEPFVLPPGHREHFGLRPASRADREFLRRYWDLDKRRFGPRQEALARDAYDDCIAYLDRHVGALLDELDRRGVLRDTTVIVTSDHGEEFGEHDVFNHGYSLYLPEVHVPLVILAPGAPAGRVVAEPVSLRDLPATVVDLAGLPGRSPFPGRSLAAHWRDAAGTSRPATSPALSEAVIPLDPPPRYARGPTQRGFVLSLVSGDAHFIRDGRGAEELFDLRADPRERANRAGTADAAGAVDRFRDSLLEILTDERVPAPEEEPYLRRYRTRLESLIRGGRAAAGAGDRPSPRRPVSSGTAGMRFDKKIRR